MFRAKGLTWREISDYYHETYHTTVMRRFQKDMQNYHALKVRIVEMAEAQQRAEAAELERLAAAEAERLANPNVVQGTWQETDTREWSNERWAKEFMGKTVLEHQEQDLQDFDRYNCIKCNPRQHGKSGWTIEPYMTRKLCESVYEPEDVTLMYVSHSQSNSIRMVMTIRSHLASNQKIIEFYGMLVDVERTEQGIQLRRNQQSQLNLTTLKDPQLTNLQGQSITSRVRGTQAKIVIIDDAVDVQSKADGVNLVKATEEFLLWYDNKIVPLIKGRVHVIGTRYLFGQDLFEKLNETGVFMWTQRAAIIGPVPAYTVPERQYDEDGRLVPITPKELVVHGELELLAPVIFATRPDSPFYNGTPAQNILFKHYIMGERAFMAELMNDPQPMSTVLKWDWFEHARELPGSHPIKLHWCVFVDIATGEQTDHTSFVLVGEYQGAYYIYDILYGHWTGAEKVKKLEEMLTWAYDRLQIDRRYIAVCCEVVIGTGRSFFQRLRDESWVTPREINPGRQGRGEKVRRIRYGVGTEMEARKVFIVSGCRGMDQLRLEVEGFPHKHPDVLDSLDQAVYWLKTAGAAHAPVAIRSPVARLEMRGR